MTGHSPSPLLRRAILGGTVALALLVALPSRTPSALAQQPTASSSAPEAPAATAPAPSATTPKKGHGLRATIDLDMNDESAKDGEAKDPAASAEDSRATQGIVVDKGGKRVRIVGGGDPDAEAIAKFAKSEPEIAGMVVAIVGIVFLSPVLLVGLIVAYRIKKARLANEAMLRLAERGVVPPAEAMQAIASGRSLPPGVVDTGPGAPSLTDQAKQLGRRAAVSDLRKGVILAAVGLGFTVASAGHRTPSTVGFILLFLGLGYIGLWWFETRQLQRTNTGSSGPDA